MKPHVQQVSCRKPSAIEAEQAGELWARGGGSIGTLTLLMEGCDDSIR